MIYVIATTLMKPEDKDDFIKGHRACTIETLKEKGCVSYDGHVSVNDPNVYVVIERWATGNDLNAHVVAPHVNVWREYSAQMRTGSTVIEIISDGQDREDLRNDANDPTYAASGPYRFAEIAGG